MLVIGTILSIILVAVIASPFFYGEQTPLQSGAPLDSPKKLLAQKHALVKRFIEDEAAYEKKRINKIMWEQRRLFLVNRYIDTARRLDYLTHLAKLASEDEGNKGDLL